MGEGEFLWRSGQRGELYDKEKDPRQFVNLAEKEEEVVAKLKKRLEERLAAMKD